MEKMSIEQLKALKEQANMEVNFLQDSLNNISTASTSPLQPSTTSPILPPFFWAPSNRMVASTKKRLADEAGAVIQSKLMQLAPST